MFHQGDLQSGIGLAVQQAKAVLCFVNGMYSAFLEHLHSTSSLNDRPDGSDVSKQWESILLDDAVCLLCKTPLGLFLICGSSYLQSRPKPSPFE